VDLVLLHWPCDDFENTVASYTALEPLVKAGKARAIGISNFNASAIAALASRTTVKPAVNQCGFSIAGHSEKTSHFGRDDDTHMACKEAGLVYSAEPATSFMILPYSRSPLLTMFRRRASLCGGWSSRGSWQ
jgi:diketogulonate reductase-like aldo/keto reductase